MKKHPKAYGVDTLVALLVWGQTLDAQVEPCHNGLNKPRQQNAAERGLGINTEPADITVTYRNGTPIYNQKLKQIAMHTTLWSVTNHGRIQHNEYFCIEMWHHFHLHFHFPLSSLSKRWHHFHRCCRLGLSRPVVRNIE